MKKHKKFVYCSLAIVILNVGCMPYPRVTEIAASDSGGQHVIARFLRSEKNYSYTELTKMLRLEFIARPANQMVDYLKEIGAECSDKKPEQSIYPPSVFTLCDIASGVCDNTTPPSIFCTYQHKVDAIYSIPTGLFTKKSMAGVSTKAISITASVEKTSGVDNIKNLTAYIIQTGGVKENH